MESYLRELVRGQPADYVEIRLEESETTRIGFRGKTLDNLGESRVEGGAVRALVGGGWGFVSFSGAPVGAPGGTVDLESKVALAIKQARLVGQRQSRKTCLAPVPVVREKVSPAIGEDPRTVTLSAKKELLEGYNARVLEYGPPIASSIVNYLDRFVHLTFVNSDGTYIEQDKLDVAGSVAAIAVRDGITQMLNTTFGSTTTFEAARGLEARVDEACRRAAALIDAPEAQGGEYTVILNPALAGVFAHEAFGHLSEADNVYENPRLREVMTLGREFGVKELNILDTGDVPGARGYLKYDDEGVATAKTYLIRGGRLVGRLHSRETAGVMGETPTGNARALDYRYPPICRMRNTCIEPGEADFEDMLNGIKLGLYARDSYGGETAHEMFTFTAGDAVMIRDGKLAETVRNVTLTGNVFETLRNIDMIGRDFGGRESYGGCGKNRQQGLPVSMGSPHIRVSRLVIGGRA